MNTHPKKQKHPLHLWFTTHSVIFHAQQPGKGKSKQQLSFKFLCSPESRIFQNTLKGLKMIQALKHSWSVLLALFFKGLFSCGRMAGQGFTGQLFQLSFHRKELLGSWDCEPGRTDKGVGQEKLERAKSARELQQSLHKRGGLCNACGFALRNSS